jgi:hypothetical protein
MVSGKEGRGRENGGGENGVGGRMVSGGENGVRGGEWCQEPFYFRGCVRTAEGQWLVVSG